MRESASPEREQVYERERQPNHAQPTPGPLSHETPRLQDVQFKQYDSEGSYIQIEYIKGA